MINYLIPDANREYHTVLSQFISGGSLMLSRREQGNFADKEEENYIWKDFMIPLRRHVCALIMHRAPKIRRAILKNGSRIWISNSDKMKEVDESAWNDESFCNEASEYMDAGYVLSEWGKSRRELLDNVKDINARSIRQAADRMASIILGMGIDDFMLCEEAVSFYVEMRGHLIQTHYGAIISHVGKSLSRTKTGNFGSLVGIVFESAVRCADRYHPDSNAKFMTYLTHWFRASDRNIDNDTSFPARWMSITDGDHDEEEEGVVRASDIERISMEKFLASKDDMDREEVEAMLEKIIGSAGLSFKESVALKLYYLGEMNYSDVGNRFGRSREWARRLVDSALKKVRDHVRKNGVTNA
ncbi:MAG: sigma-70 family RNA polymerase sigma factor [Methanobacteriota archaeon]|nr:MAG: sigma-70 family RNA polymerase sigma factor [Euryarchaeota archaeon]